MLQVVNYHYVLEFPVKGLYYLDVKTFRRQLLFLQQNHTFISKADLFEILDDPASVERLDGVLLTFDDGLKCHYDVVLPVLEELGLWGVFFCSSGPVTDKVALPVHKLHKVLNSLNPAVVDQFIENNGWYDSFAARAKEDFSVTLYSSQQSAHALTLKIKSFFNYLVDPDMKIVMLDSIIKYFDIQIKTCSLYASLAQIKALHDRGMVIGSHTCNHHVMSTLSGEQQYAEISQDLNFWRGIFGREFSELYAHPFGRSHTYNELTLEYLRELGIHSGFGVEPRPIIKRDLETNKLALPRYDCTDLPFGKSCFSDVSADT